MKRLHLAQKLSLLPKDAIDKLSYLIGFDGFIDELCVCVDKRSDQATYEPIQFIHEFAKRTLEASGKSTNLELVVTHKKIGGNGPILTTALVAIGVKPCLIGALGYPEIDPIFSSLLKECSDIFSISNPGHTDALEFLDGKILLGKQGGILDIDIEQLLCVIGKGQLLQLFDKARFFVSVNWTMIMGMTTIWRYLAKEILPSLTPIDKPRYLFVDLADPAKRTNQDLQEALDQLQAFRDFYHVSLSLNELEARRIMHLLNPQLKEEAKWLSKTQIVEAARWLQSTTHLDLIIIHATKYAAAATEEEVVVIDGPYCEKPTLTTGGGDNFNAGFLLGLGLDFSLEEALLLAVHMSGFYVKNGKSPNKKELISFLRYQEMCLLETPSTAQ